MANFGAELPMGSENVRGFAYYDAYYPNLNAGTGKPCAGQRRLMEVFCFRTNRLSLASDENFGKDPLIGSETISPILPNQITPT